MNMFNFLFVCIVFGVPVILGASGVVLFLSEMSKAQWLSLALIAVCIGILYISKDRVNSITKK